MEIPFSHHPAIRLFMFSLMGGTAVLLAALMIFLALEHLGNKTSTDNNTQSSIINSAQADDMPTEINTNTPVVATYTAHIAGMIEEINALSITIRVQGYQTLTDKETFTLSTNADTEYSVVDTRTPVTPGSGGVVSAHHTTRDVITSGMHIAATLNEGSDVAKAITIIQ